MCVSPYGCSVEAKKLRDPQGISSLNEPRIVAARMRELNYVVVVTITSGMCSLVWGETVAENSLGLVLLQRGSFFDDCFSIARNTIFVK